MFSCLYHNSEISQRANIQNVNSHVVKDYVESKKDNLENNLVSSKRNQERRLLSSTGSENRKAWQRLLKSKIFCFIFYSSNNIPKSDKKYKLKIKWNITE